MERRSEIRASGLRIENWSQTLERRSEVQAPFSYARFSRKTPHTSPLPALPVAPLFAEDRTLPLWLCTSIDSIYLLEP